MQKDALNNVHISAEQVLITPEELKNQFPLSADDENEIATARNTIANILQGRDHRLLVVCALFDPRSGRGAGLRPSFENPGG